MNPSDVLNIPNVLMVSPDVLVGYIQFLKSVAWLSMLNLQVPWSDHLTEVLNHDLLFSVPCCFLLDHLIKETTCNVMIDHLQSRVPPWRQYVRHVKVRGTFPKMDVSLDVLMNVLRCTHECPPMYS